MCKIFYIGLIVVLFCFPKETKAGCEPICNYYGSVEICSGDSIELTFHVIIEFLCPFSGPYFWEKDGVPISGSNFTESSSYFAKSPGEYNVVSSDNYHFCSVKLSYIENQPPSINTNENFVITDAVGVYYQWLMNGEEIKGATDSAYKVIRDGYYQVMIMDTFECNSVKSESLYVKSYNENIVISTLYPNPNTGTFQIMYSIANEGEAQFIVYDYLGKKLAARTLKNKFQTLTISLDDIETGVYFYHLVLNGESTQSGRFIVVK